jgi:hypothetical protein
MTIVQMYLTATSQYVDFNMPSGRYHVKLVGAQTCYTIGDGTIFTLQLRSQFTRVKWGNVPYIQISFPNAHHSQIQGEIQWDVDYMGAFQMEVIDVGTGLPPAANRFSQATYYLDVTPIDPNQNIKF